MKKIINLEYYFSKKVNIYGIVFSYFIIIVFSIFSEIIFYKIEIKNILKY